MFQVGLSRVKQMTVIRRCYETHTVLVPCREACPGGKGKSIKLKRVAPTSGLFCQSGMFNSAEVDTLSLSLWQYPVSLPIKAQVQTSFANNKTTTEPLLLQSSFKHKDRLPFKIQRL
jgi:hypothetical protein